MGTRVWGVDLVSGSLHLSQALSLQLERHALSHAPLFPLPPGASPPRGGPASGARFSLYIRFRCTCDVEVSNLGLDGSDSVGQAGEFRYASDYSAQARPAVHESESSALVFRV